MHSAKATFMDNEVRLSSGIGFERVSVAVKIPIYISVLHRLAQRRCTGMKLGKRTLGRFVKKNSIKTTSTEQLSLEPVSIIIWER